MFKLFIDTNFEFKKSYEFIIDKSEKTLSLFIDLAMLISLYRRDRILLEEEKNFSEIFDFFQRIIIQKLTAQTETSLFVIDFKKHWIINKEPTLFNEFYKLLIDNSSQEFITEDQLKFNVTNLIENSPVLFFIDSVVNINPFRIHRENIEFFGSDDHDIKNEDYIDFFNRDIRKLKFFFEKNNISVHSNPNETLILLQENEFLDSFEIYLKMIYKFYKEIIKQRTNVIIDSIIKENVTFRNIEEIVIEITSNLPSSLLLERYTDLLIKLLKPMFIEYENNSNTSRFQKESVNLLKKIQWDLFNYLRSGKIDFQTFKNQTINLNYKPFGYDLFHFTDSREFSRDLNEITFEKERIESITGGTIDDYVESLYKLDNESKLIRKPFTDIEEWTNFRNIIASPPPQLKDEFFNLNFDETKFKTLNIWLEWLRNTDLMPRKYKLPKEFLKSNRNRFKLVRNKVNETKVIAKTENDLKTIKPVGTEIFVFDQFLDDLEEYFIFLTIETLQLNTSNYIKHFDKFIKIPSSLKQFYLTLQELNIGVLLFISILELKDYNVIIMDDMNVIDKFKRLLKFIHFEMIHRITHLLVWVKRNYGENVWLNYLFSWSRRILGSEKESFISSIKKLFKNTPINENDINERAKQFIDKVVNKIEISSIEITLDMLELSLRSLFFGAFENINGEILTFTHDPYIFQGYNRMGTFYDKTFDSFQSFTKNSFIEPDKDPHIIRHYDGLDGAYYINLISKTNKTIKEQDLVYYETPMKTIIKIKKIETKGWLKPFTRIDWLRWLKYTIENDFNLIKFDTRLLNKYSPSPLLFLKRFKSWCIGEFYSFKPKILNFETARKYDIKSGPVITIKELTTINDILLWFHFSFKNEQNKLKKLPSIDLEKAPELYPKGIKNINFDNYFIIFFNVKDLFNFEKTEIITKGNEHLINFGLNIIYFGKKVEPTTKIIETSFTISGYCIKKNFWSEKRIQQFNYYILTDKGTSPEKLDTIDLDLFNQFKNVEDFGKIYLNLEILKILTIFFNDTLNFEQKNQFIDFVIDEILNTRRISITVPFDEFGFTLLQESVVEEVNIFNPILDTFYLQDPTFTVKVYFDSLIRDIREFKIVTKQNDILLEILKKFLTRKYPDISTVPLNLLNDLDDKNIYILKRDIIDPDISFEQSLIHNFYTAIIQFLNINNQDFIVDLITSILKRYHDNGIIIYIENIMDLYTIYGISNLPDNIQEDINELLEVEIDKEFLEFRNQLLSNIDKKQQMVLAIDIVTSNDFISSLQIDDMMFPENISRMFEDVTINLSSGQPFIVENLKLSIETERNRPNPSKEELNKLRKNLRDLERRLELGDLMVNLLEPSTEMINNIIRDELVYKGVYNFLIKKLPDVRPIESRVTFLSKEKSFRRIVERILDSDLNLYFNSESINQLPKGFTTNYYNFSKSTTKPYTESWYFSLLYSVLLLLTRKPKNTIFLKRIETLGELKTIFKNDFADHVWVNLNNIIFKEETSREDSIDSISNLFNITIKIYKIIVQNFQKRILKKHSIWFTSYGSFQTFINLLEYEKSTTNLRSLIHYEPLIS